MVFEFGRFKQKQPNLGSCGETNDPPYPYAHADVKTIIHPSPAPMQKVQNRAKSEGTLEKTGNPTIRYHCNAAQVVHEAFEKHGFVEADSESEKFTYLWGWPSAHELIKRVQPGQMVNQMPGQFALTRKDNLAQTIQEFLRNHKQIPEFIPKTFVLPANEIILRAYMQQHARRYFIVKEALANRGEGIEIIRGSQRWTTERDAVVQEYLRNPLLINGYKFDFRVYVLVLSADPLVVYRYDEGLARFATTPYERPTLKTQKNLQQHLTNFSVNKQAMAEISDDSDDSDGFEGQVGSGDTRTPRNKHGLRQEGFAFKQKMSTVLGVLSQQDAYKNTLQQIDDIIKYTVVAAEPKMAANAYSARAVALPRKCFAFLGFDLICEASGTLKLLEVNACPSTACETAVDWEIKRKLFDDIISLTTPKKYFVRNKLVVQTMASEDSLPKDKGGREFSQKIQQLREVLSSKDSVSATYAAKVKPGLTEFEQKLLKQLQLDQKKKGAFTRLIPAANTSYLEYFEQAKYTDYLAALWAATGGI